MDMLTTLTVLALAAIITVGGAFIVISLIHRDGVGRLIHAYKKLKKSDPSTWEMRSIKYAQLYDGTRKKFYSRVEIIVDPETKVELFQGEFTYHEVIKKFNIIHINHPYSQDHKFTRGFSLTLKWVYTILVCRYVEKRICDIVAAQEL